MLINVKDRPQNEPNSPSGFFGFLSGKSRKNSTTQNLVACTGPGVVADIKEEEVA